MSYAAARSASSRPAVARNSVEWEASDRAAAARQEPRPVATGDYREVAATAAAGRTFRLLAAPSSSGGRCAKLLVGGSETALCPRPADLREPLGTVSPQEHRAPPPPYAVFWGEVQPLVRAVELRYEDGATARLPLSDGFVLFVVPSDRHTPGRRVALLVARDAEGRVVERRRLDRRR